MIANNGGRQRTKLRLRGGSAGAVTRPDPVIRQFSPALFHFAHYLVCGSPWSFNELMSQAHCGVPPDHATCLAMSKLLQQPSQVAQGMPRAGKFQGRCRAGRAIARRTVCQHAVLLQSSIRAVLVQQNAMVVVPHLFMVGRLVRDGNGATSSNFTWNPGSGAGSNTCPSAS